MRMPSVWSSGVERTPSYSERTPFNIWQKDDQPLSENSHGLFGKDPDARCPLSILFAGAKNAGWPSLIYKKFVSSYYFTFLEIFAINLLEATSIFGLNK